MKDIFNFFEKPKDPLLVHRDPHLARVAGEDPRVVARRGEEAGDDQLPHLQAGAGRPLLRQDLRPGEGLRVQLRQVQAHEAPRRRLREVRRRGHPVQGAPRAAGPHQPGHAGRAHLVPEVAAVAHRQPARHHAQGPREGPLLRGVHRHRPEGDAACSAASSSPRSATASCSRRRRRRVRRRHGRRGDPRAAQAASTSHTLAEQLRSEMREATSRGQAQEDRQAPQGRRGVPRVAATSPSG